MDNNNEKRAFNYLNDVINSYYSISPETWENFLEICTYKQIKKNDYLCRSNENPSSFFFVYEGLLRNYITDEKGNEFNKIFFSEGMFPGSMVSLLKNEPSLFEIQVLEDSSLIEINFDAYRDLLLQYEDLKMFHISYLEENWLIKKESEAVSFVQKDADERYEDFLKDYPKLSTRLTQYHIAAYLGITPTQLSRIRKKINICK